jgi:hypothetical protein
MNKLLAMLLLIVVAPLAFAACGGSDAPSKDEYISQADEICQKAQDDVAAAITEEFGDRMPNQQETVSFSEDVVIPKLEEQLAALRDLTPPEGDEEALQEMYGTLEVAINQYKENIDPENPPEAFLEFDRLIEEYGLEACGGN